MPNRLSMDLWLEKKPPFYWIKVESVPTKSTVYVQIIEKWLDENTSGWWYRDGSMFVFGVLEDRATFKFWLLSGVFDDDYGEVLSNGVSD